MAHPREPFIPAAPLAGASAAPSTAFASSTSSASSAQHLQHLQLRLAADAARTSLAQLQQEFDQVKQHLDDMAESMQMLQNVIDAWERLNPERDPLARQLRRIDQELRAAEPAPLSAFPDLAGVQQIALGRRGAGVWPARGEVAERVHRVLMTGAPLSPGEAHAAIDARYRTSYSINAVSIAMRHGAEAGRYLYNGRTGKYRIAAAG